MSFIGPRPLLVEYLNKYSNYEKRHLVKPGITDWLKLTLSLQEKNLGKKVLNSIFFMQPTLVFF